MVNNEVYTSTDDGATWNALHIRQIFPFGYPRNIMVQPDDPKTVFLTIGDSTPGRIGTVMRSKDVGKTWESLNLSVQPTSPCGRCMRSRTTRRPWWLVAAMGICIAAMTVVTPGGSSGAN